MTGWISAGILEASGYDENGNIIEQERLLTTQNAAGIKAEMWIVRTQDETFMDWQTEI